jgi:hypothetical protein
MPPIMNPFIYPFPPTIQVLPHAPPILRLILPPLNELFPHPFIPPTQLIPPFDNMAPSSNSSPIVSSHVLEDFEEENFYNPPSSLSHHFTLP